MREYEYEETNRLIEEMIEESYGYDDMMNGGNMKRMVPEFKSVNSVFEKLDRELIVNRER